MNEDDAVNASVLQVEVVADGHFELDPLDASLSHTPSLVQATMNRYIYVPSDSPMPFTFTL